MSDSARAKEIADKLEIESIQKIQDNQLVASITNTLNNLNSRIAAQKKSYDEVDDLVKNKEKLLAHTPAIQPVSNKDLNRVASGFGYRIDPVYKTTKFHAGRSPTSSRPRSALVKLKKTMLRNASSLLHMNLNPHQSQQRTADTPR
jgi:hypothetical protein